MQSNNTDKVSIIIPTHNRVKLLKRAVDSCLKQTHPEIELIIINDGSADGTKEYLDSLSNVTVIHNETPKGAPYCRNIGAAGSSGFYLSFVDDDDMLLPDKTAKQVEKFKELNDPGVGVMSCDSLEIRDDKKIVLENRKKGFIYKDLLAKYCVVGGTLALMFRRDVFFDAGMFDENLKSNQEYDLMIRAAKNYNFDFVPEVLVHKYETSGQISTDFSKKASGTAYFLMKNHSRFLEFGLLFYLKHTARLTALILFYRLSKLFGIRFYRLVFP